MPERFDSIDVGGRIVRDGGKIRVFDGNITNFRDEIASIFMSSKGNIKFKKSFEPTTEVPIQTLYRFNIDVKSGIYMDSTPNILSNVNPQRTFSISYDGITSRLNLGQFGVRTNFTLNSQGLTLRDASYSNSEVRLKGRIECIDDGNKPSIIIEGKNGNIKCGGDVDGDILLFKAGTNLENASSSESTIHLDGDAGDIILRNADCAEEFDTIDTEQLEPGTVMTIDSTGKLKVSNRPYDKKVAGVISGAGGYKPGIILDRHQKQKNRVPIALLGKVFCKVIANDSSYIEEGDLLTTSEIPGYAMKAIDPKKSFGTIIGKALKSHKFGKSLIPIIVNLQ